MRKGVSYVAAWKDYSTGQSYSMSGNDKTAYAQEAARIQAAIDKGHQVDREALDIINKAKYIGVAPFHS